MIVMALLDSTGLITVEVTVALFVFELCEGVDDPIAKPALVIDNWCPSTLEELESWLLDVVPTRIGLTISISFFPLRKFINFVNKRN
jgi:hypothetical protein